ncbi:hypothetical protein F5B20DRAFT_522805 [Whalleya microplaca]|nr:hypothetical protein F5B20DRAFT_522805 [Whalleya microplaca]
MVHFGLFPPLVTCASAAYVQWQHCDDHTPGLPAFIPESLSASLVPVDDTHDRLSLRIGRWLEESECARWAAEIMSVNIDFDMLGHSSSHHHKVNATCQRLALESNLFILSLTATEDTDAFYALSTFHTAIHLVGPNAEEKGCLQANITPAFSPAIQATLRYAPLTILVFVLLVGIARSVSDSSTSTEAWARAVLPGFADCLQYLQSIFLTGSLSLFYPGFYQPVVSRLGWVSLFADGSITHSRTYAGINDGIYELNGTYGGTFGLELMTQIVGAPMTMDTWLNMVILIMAIAALAALCLEIYWLMNRPVGADTGLRRTFNRTLHMILSYFMLPLIALSFYQIDNASYLPSYHIFLAALLLAIILIAFVWLLSQIPTRSLGVLIFDSRRRYNQIITSETSDGQHKSFVLALFVLLFIRGAAIGGLQISGQAQLAVLGACELVLLACIVQFQAYNMLSTGTISAVARLGSLICMIMLIPGVASDTTRSAIGYLILLIHGCVLVFGFLVPAMIQLGKLCSHWWNRPTPRVDVRSLGSTILQSSCKR